MKSLMKLLVLTICSQTVSTPCDTANGNCEQLCLLGAGRTATCACVEEYTLASDGRTCETPGKCSATIITDIR